MTNLRSLLAACVVGSVAVGMLPLGSVAVAAAPVGGVVSTVSVVPDACEPAVLEVAPSPSPSATGPGDRPEVGPGSESAPGVVGTVPESGLDAGPSTGESGASAAPSEATTPTPAPGATDESTMVVERSADKDLVEAGADESVVGDSAGASEIPVESVPAQPVELTPAPIVPTPEPSALDEPVVPSKPSESVSPEPSVSPSDDTGLELVPSAEPSEPLVDEPSCPVVVSGLAATAGINEVSLSWQHENSSVVHAFIVQVSPDDRLVQVSAPADGVTVSGLRNGVEYNFVVYSVSDLGASEPSASVSSSPTSGVEGEVAGLIVGFEASASVTAGQDVVPGEGLVDEVGLSVDAEITDGIHTVDFTESVTLAEAKSIAADLVADPAVTWAEPDQFVFTAAVDQTVVPDDAQFASDQWNLWDTYGVGLGDGPDQMSSFYSPSAGAGATVAVIDTGITAHPDLDGALVSGRDFVSDPSGLASPRVGGGPDVGFDADGTSGWDDDPTDPGDWRAVAPIRDSSWHGTHIAGVIAARSGNTQGVAGITPGAKVQPIRALSWRGGLLSDIAASITWASGGHVDGVADNPTPADVINMSFALQAPCSVALQSAITQAHERGTVLVAAAGNANANVNDYAPANCTNVIAVGATSRDGLRAPYSNFGPGIDIAAPGGSGTTSSGVTSTTNLGTTTTTEPGYAAKEGTSIAAAHVSSAAAWLVANTPPVDGQTHAARATALAKRLTGKTSVRSFAAQQCDPDTTKTCGPGILDLAQIAAAGEPGVDVNVTVNDTAIADGSTVAVGSTVTLGTSGLMSPGSGGRTLRTTLHSGTVYQAGTAVAPEGWTINYSSNNGTTWSGTQPTPASAVTDIRATATATAGLIEGTSQIYSSETTSSVPSSTFLANAGGDGYNAFFYDSFVFNIFHHNGSGTYIMCHLKATSARCPGFASAFAITGYQSSMRSTGWVDATSGRLYTIGTKDGKAWALCVDVSTSTPSFCGATELASGSINDYTHIAESVSHGRRLFGTESAGTNSLMCFDAATGARCPGTPIDLVGASTTGGGSMSMTRPAIMDGRLFVTTSSRLYCFDPETLVSCAGSWPASITPWSSNGMAMGIAPHVNSSETLDGVCYYSASTVYTCLNLDGTANATWKSPFSLGRPAHPHIAMGIETLGRFYYGSGQYQVGCWDYATQASCANYPKTFPGSVRIVYGVTLDPENPACIWMNSDAGYIYNFDAYSAADGCNANPVITLQPSQFAPRYACSTPNGITEWTQLRLVSLTGGTASTVKLTVRTAQGATVPGWVDKVVPVTQGATPLGTLDMTGLDPSVSGSRPTFSFAFSSVTGTLSTAVIALDYKGKGPELCVDTVATAASPPVTATVTGTLTEMVGVEETFTDTRTFQIGNSASLVTLTVPGVPQNLTGTGLNTTATLTFQPPTNDGGTAITGYSVSTNGGSTYSDASIVDNGDGTLSTTVSGLTPGSTYDMRVAANNSVGRGAAASISITAQYLSIATLADTPVNQGPITMAATTSGGLPLTYTASPSSVCTAGGAGGRTITLVAMGTCDLVANQAGDANANPVILPAETPGSFQVLAAYYEPTLPGVPTGLTLTPGNGQMSLSWTAPVDDGYTPLTDYSVQYKAASSGSWIPFIDGVSTSTTALIPSLTNGTSYNFRVAAVNAVGTGSYTATSSATPATIPGAPTSLAASGTGTSRTLTWTAPASNGGSAITDYLVEYKLSSSASWTTFNDGTTSTTGATVTGLTNAADYDYQVTTINAVGSSTSTSTVNLTTTPGNGQVALAWSAPASPGGTIIDYEMQYRANDVDAWTTFPDAVSTSTGGTVTGLTNGTDYRFRVATLITGSVVSSYTSVVIATPRTTPTAPTITATPGNRQVALTWAAPANGGSAITDYVVQYKASSSGSWSTFAEGTSASTGATVTGLLNGTAYDFKVSATNAVGTGSASSEESATPRTTPGTPGAITATAGASQVSLSWTAPASTGGSALTDYDIEYKTSSALTWTTWTHTPSTAITSTITGLTNGTTYNFRIAAVNIAGSGSYATTVSATPRTVPDAPTAFTATNGDTTVDLSWTAPTGNGGSPVTDYVIEFKISSDGTWTTIADGTNTTTTYQHTGRTNGTTYDYRIAAVNTVGAGSATSTTGTPRTLPGVPRTLAATPGSTQVALTWLAPISDGGGTITDYAVEYKESTSPTWLTFTDGISSSLTATVTGLNNGTEYDFRIAAVNSAGTGPATTTETSTPVAPAPSSGSSTPRSDPEPAPVSSAPPPEPTPEGPQEVPSLTNEEGAVLIDGVLMDITITPMTGGSGGTPSSWQVSGPDFQLTFTPQQNPNGTSLSGPAEGLKAPSGGWVTVRGDGYAGDSAIKAYLIFKPVTRTRATVIERVTYLGETTVEPDGTFGITVDIPEDAEPGDYILQVNGMSVTYRVRSVNMALRVSPAIKTETVQNRGVVTKKAFFQGRSAAFTPIGIQRLRTMVRRLPDNATNVRIRIDAASVSLNDLQSNLLLAGERGQEIVNYLKGRGIKGSYTIRIKATETFADNPSPTPSERAAQKPLTTVTMTYTVTRTIPRG